MRFSNFTFDDNGVYIKNLANNADKYGVAAYRFPHCYELVGKEFTMAAADKEYTIKFKCKTCAELDGKECKYELIKQETGMYFVLLGCTAGVLDLVTGQAALVLNGKIVPGYLKGIGTEAPVYDAEGMVETKVDWVFGVGRYLNQDFFSADTLKATWSLDGLKVEDHYTAVLGPKTKENAYEAVRFRDSFWFVNSDNQLAKNACVPATADKVILLEDFERCMACGVILGKGFDPITVTGYARF